MSLLRNHKDINSGNRSDLDAAVTEILKIKGNVGKFSTDDITNMINGSAWIHHTWSGDVYQVIARSPTRRSGITRRPARACRPATTPSSFPRAAKHPGTALKFIDWMLDPDNARANVNYFGYPQVTTSGIDEYQKLVAKLSVPQPVAGQAIHGLREIVPTGAKLQLWTAEWTKVKAG